MNQRRLYDLWCKTVGGGLAGHPHWDDIEHERRLQFGKLHKMLEIEYTAPTALDAIPPPDGGGDGNSGGPPTP
jgi:hypothetical protein